MNTREILLVGMMAAWSAVPASGQVVPTLYTVDGGFQNLTGRGVSGAGDLDGDHVEDVLIGSPRNGFQQLPSDAVVRAHSGKTGVVIHTVDGTSLWGPLGDASGLPGVDSSFGWSISGLGDTDEDGVGDYVVGSPAHLSFLDSPGRVGIFSGGSGQVRLVLEGGDLGEPGFGEADGFGWAVTRIRDVDDDGVEDVLVGAPFGGDGYARVHSGANGDLIHHLEPDDLTFGSNFGMAVTALDDLDGDGVGDFAVAAPGWGGFYKGKSSEMGRVYLYSGAEATRIRALQGNGPGWQFGASLASGLDVDGDDIQDIIVGAPGAAFGNGRVFVYTGRGAASAQGGLALAIPAPSRDEFGFGTTVAPAGDVDDDGTGDVLVGVPYDLFEPADEDDAPTYSHVYALSGETGAELARLEATDFGWELGGGIAFVGDLFDSDSDAFVLGAPGYGGADGRAVVAFVPGPSQQNSLPEPENALDGRPGGPALVRLPLDGSDIAFGTLVVTPQADGDSVAGELLEEAVTAFTDFGESQVGSNPQEAATGDFNNDGRDDFATANSGDDSVSTVVSDGPTAFSGTPGGLGTVTTISTGVNSNPRAIAAGDLNADDFDDLVVSGDMGVSSYVNDMSGGFVAADLHAIPVVTDIDLADLDGDRDLDALVTSGGLLGSGGARVLLGDGDGTFTAGTNFGGGPPVVSAQLADVDLDGDIDATLVTHYVFQGLPRSEISAHLNDGLGVFTPAGWELQVTSVDGSVPTFGAFNDISRDGLPDLVLTNNDNFFAPPGSFAGNEPPLEITILINDGTDIGGTWTGFTTSVLGTAYAGRAMEPILEDVFTDPDQPLATDPDLILVWYMDELAGQSPVPQPTAFIGILIGDGEGGFFDPDPNQFVLGDQPGDGDQGDVAGPFDDPGAPTGDGRPDLVFPNLLSNSLKVLVSDGDGGVASVGTITDVDELDPATLPPGLWSGGPRSVRMTHLDGDGLLDLVVYNDWRDDFLGDVRASLSLYVSTGGGGFSKTQYLPLPRSGEIRIADADLDGIDDVIVLQAIGPGSEDRVRVHRGLGNGTLALQPDEVQVPGRTLTGGLAEGSLGAGAGRAVVVTARDPDTGEGILLTYPLRQGVGLLPPIVSDLDTNWKLIDGLELADMDGDGFTDACLGTISGRLILARGDGVGGFVEVPVNPAAAAVGGGALAVGLIDGDDIPDIVSSKGKVASQAGVHVLSGTGFGDFTANLLAGLSASGDSGAQRPLLVDYDDDGTLDVILSHGTTNSISVLLSELNAVEEVDPGQAGSGGITPRLKAKGYTTLGSKLELQMDDTVGGAEGWLLVGFEAQPGNVPAVPVEGLFLNIPFSFGGEPGEPGAGDGEVMRVRLPVDPAAVGMELFLQLVVEDEGASGDPTPFSLSASNAISLTILD
jgi:hypothetical protein